MQLRIANIPYALVAEDNFNELVLVDDTKAKLRSSTDLKTSLLSGLRTGTQAGVLQRHPTNVICHPVMAQYR